MYKLISLDMDNTTLNPEHKISDRTKKTLQKAHNKGVKIIINTGRTYEEVKSYISELDFADYIVTSNGSVVFDKLNYTFHQVNNLDKIYVDECHKICKKYNDKLMLLVAGERDCYSDLVYKDSEAKPMFEKIVGISINMEENVLEFFENKFIGKAVIIGERKSLENVKYNMENIFKDSVQLKYSLECALEVLSPCMDKSEGVNWVLEKLGISSNEIIAIGDGENDIGMIKQASLGIAMSNACESLKRVADYITLSNSEDGVAHAVEKFVLS